MRSTKKQKTSRKSGIGNPAVLARTGKGWTAWFDLLDAGGGQEMNHKEIVAWLHGRHDRHINGWWQQMITVAYEQARGKRVKHEKTGGFEVSASKTVGVPLRDLYGSWAEDRAVRRWLTDGRFTIRKATPNKTMRLSWKDGTTRLNVYFYARGRCKSQVTVSHTKLTSARAATRMQNYWKSRLDHLRERLEKPTAGRRSE